MTKSAHTVSAAERGLGIGSNNRVTSGLRGFGPLGLLAILFILAGSLIFTVLGAILVLSWAKASHTPWMEIGYSAPKSWPRALAIGVLFGVLFKLVMKILVMPLLGAPPINSAYHFLVGNTAALPAMVLTILTSAAFAEETVYRGWMFERLGKLLGRRFGAKIVIVLTTSTLFAIAHYSNQGMPGVEQAMITGIVFGTIFIVAGNIILPMIAHGAFDLTAVAIIYSDLESRLAHLIIR